MNQKTHQQQQKLARAFCNIRSARDISQLLRVDYRQLMLLIKQPRYKTFTVPKKDGGERLIENPTPLLKKVQSQLNRYLQAIYYFEKSNASYGFIVGVLNDDDRRNILTNARKHVNRLWLLNVDLKDFFHFVTLEQVAAVFQGAPFSFKGDLPDLLAQLTTFQGRLPMGAPTSPVLSNLACRNLDETLMTFAQAQGWVYTRYADDLSFSAKLEITDVQITALRQQITSFGFQINEKKLRLYAPDDTKIVTGLLVTNKVDLAPEFLPLLEKEIAQLKNTIEVQNVQGELSTYWVEQFKLQIRGKLNFVGFVLGRRNDRYIQLKDSYYTAINPPEDEFGAVSWRSFPYNR